MIFLAALILQAATVPEVIRDTTYDWRCVDEFGVVVSNHQRQDKAIVSCQNAALANPGTTYFVEAGRYRVIVGAPPTAVLTWEAPTLNVDGSPIKPITHYTLFKGLVSRSYTDTRQVPAADLSYVWEPLAPATHYFAITVTVDDGSESAYSNEVTKTVQ